jgi:Secretion system C-terminal sorting domain
MKNSRALLIILLLFSCTTVPAAIRLIALTNAGKPSVTLEWNMVNYPGNTAYTLFKSIDGVVWEIVAANPVFRNYTSSTILAYKDKFSEEQQLYYRVKVYDTNENIVEISNTTKVANPTNNHPTEKSFKKKDITAETENPVIHNDAAWQIFPTPVHDMLNIIYRRNEIIKGVINIVVQDASGKVVIRFRASSNNKQLHIPVSNLHAGIYFVSLDVEKEVQLKDKFIKR